MRPTDDDQHTGRATPGGEGPSSERPLDPDEGARSESPREPGDPGELGLFVADEEASRDEAGAQPTRERDRDTGV